MQTQVKFSVSVSFHQYSVSYEVQQFFSTTGVAREDYLKQLYRSLRYNVNNLGTWYNLNNLGFCSLSTQTSGGFHLKL